MAGSPGELLAFGGGLGRLKIIPPVRRPAREVDQKPVEAVTLLEVDERADEDLAVEPDVRGLGGAVQEVVSEGELAHDRHAVWHFMVHGRLDAFSRRHVR